MRQIMSAIAEVTGIEFEPVIAPRRGGDPARIVASGELAARDINWQMRHSLLDMVVERLGGAAIRQRTGRSAPPEARAPDPDTPKIAKDARRPWARFGTDRMQRGDRV